MSRYQGIQVNLLDVIYRRGPNEDVLSHTEALSEGESSFPSFDTDNAKRT